ncbi:hypothetical protein MYX78_08270 [Acidobacteria bacterium AH-259-G07]|nr:hypothetical protein [Acidobacteria bacterium AH-259-G07]
MTDIYTKTLLTLIAGCLLWLCFVIATLPEIAVVTDQYCEEEEPPDEPELLLVSQVPQPGRRESDEQETE